MTAPLSPRTPPTAGLPTALTDAPPRGTQVWHPTRDPAFFRIVARLFPPSTTSAMSVLLAAEDEEVPEDAGPGSRPWWQPPQREPRS